MGSGLGTDAVEARAAVGFSEARRELWEAHFPQNRQQLLRKGPET